MSDTPPRAEDATAATAMPPSVRVSVIVLAVLAVLLLTNAGLTWFGREQVIDALVGASGISRTEARGYVVMWLTPYLVVGLVMALSAVFLARRRPWARWLGLGTTVALGLLTVFSVVVSGGATMGSLLLLVLSAAGVASLLSRTTTAWVPGLRGRS